MNQQQLSDEELHVYSRQLFLPDWDIEAQIRLKNSHVLLIGAGGLGCSCAEILVRAGVGHLTIVDFDEVEISNIQRQTAFTAADVGLKKVAVLQRHLQNINPWVKITAIDTRFDESFEQYQPPSAALALVLDGCDNFATRDAVNRYCVRRQLPLLSASAIGYQGQLLFVRGQPCYQCLFGDMVEDTRRCADSGVLTSTVITLAALQAHHALLYLGLAEQPLLNQLLLWNGRTMQQRIVHIAPDPECMCAGHALAQHKAINSAKIEK